jgi:hypothetical protein
MHPNPQGPEREQTGDRVSHRVGWGVITWRSTERMRSSEMFPTASAANDAEETG